MKHPELALFRRLLQQARPYWVHVVGIFLLGLLATPLGLLAPLPLKIAIDSAIGTHTLPRFLNRILPPSAARSPATVLAIAVVLLLGIAALENLFALANSFLRTWTAEKLLLDFRARLFSHLQRLSLGYHDVKGSTDSVYRIQYDTASMQYLTIDGLGPFVTSVVTLLAMFYVTFRIDPQLALVAMVISPILFMLSMAYRPRFRKRSKEVKQLESSSMAVLQEVLSVVRVVKAFGREKHEEDRYVHKSRAGMWARIRLDLLGGSYSLLVGLTTALGTACVLWIGVYHVRAGTLTLGSLLLVVSYLGQLYAPLKTIGRKATSLQTHWVGLERAFSVLDQLPDVPERANARPLVRASGSVAFQHASFAYEEDHPVLQDICFEVPRGARVGISGRTGAGKTTLLTLLTRFYDPTSGRILLDGVDLRDYKLADLRNQFGIVLQEPILFSTSIGENIAYARPEASQAEIIAAAKAANAHDFISRLPKGYETPVGERGMCLSGGERQRVAIARAFLKDAPILLLDEPTSSVDMKTEAAILKATERLMQDRTTFMVAHRRSTLENCDVMLELEHGSLVHMECYK